jgi:argininosuccinate lyase
VNTGTPFRDAYKQVGLAIESGDFKYNTTINHTHEGSIGNLGTAHIKRQMEKIVESFPFSKINTAIQKLAGT